jgi:hypothetical protein
MKKKVLLPIEVPVGDYCWDWKMPCTHFSNEGGHPVCDLGIDYFLKMCDTGVKKPEYCKNLEGAK